jgi:hypothetical protein
MFAPRITRAQTKAFPKATSVSQRSSPFMRSSGGGTVEHARQKSSDDEDTKTRHETQHLPSRAIRGALLPASDLNRIPAVVRAKMESSLGADFSDVQIRTGSARALELNARAFTQGSEIHVAPGHWAPETSSGQELLGHELSHVLQQRAGRVAATSHYAGSDLNDDPVLEREANVLGTRAARAPGPNFPPLAAMHGGVARPNGNRGTALQRNPLRHPDPIHDPLLDEFSADTGIPRERASQHDPTYEAWLTVRGLSRLSVDGVLWELSDTQQRGSLDGLIANSRALPLVRFNRELTAMQVVHQSRGPGANTQTALATVAASGLPASDQLAMSHYVRVPTTQSTDQRAAVAPGGAAALPDADLSREIGYELEPSSRPPPNPPQPQVNPPAQQGVPQPQQPQQPPPQRIPWDGRDGAPNQAAARSTMKTEMFAAFDAYLTFFRPQTVASLARPRVSMNAPAAPAGASPAPTGVVDIANQARAVLEMRYATSMDAAAPTAAVTAGRASRTAAPGAQNIFDPYSEADRSAQTGITDLAPNFVLWMFGNDAPGAAGAAGSRRFGTEILAAHHFSMQDPGATQFRWDVSRDYAAANTLQPSNSRQIIDYRLTVSEQGSHGITIQSSFDPGANPNRSELVERWGIFKTATHESLHLRTHPRFSAATSAGDETMQEGFTEMFTIATLNTDVLPNVRSGLMEPLRHAVEGALSPAAPDATLVTNRTTPPQYIPHRAQAERIRDGGTPTGGSAHAGVGEAAVRAAYFEGHVEYLGLAPDGQHLTTLRAAGATPLTRIPTGIRGLDDLAWRSGVPRATIVQDNPGITDALPTAATLAGCREHWVVAGETRDRIAAQNGVSEASLVRANPDIALDPATSAWAALPVGQKILIPRH